MSKYNVPEILENVFWVGVKDWNCRLFDALIPLPKGTTYNTYLLKGEAKTALVDTVKPGFEGELEAKIRQLTNPAEIDYIIMNHAEPDHAGGIPRMMALSGKTKLVTTSKGAEAARIYYGVPEGRIEVVTDSSIIDLGGKTLRFIEAPWLHWPETMFTYLVEGKALFPCDFFGAHIAEGIYDREVEDLMVHAQTLFRRNNYAL